MTGVDWCLPLETVTRVPVELVPQQVLTDWSTDDEYQFHNPEPSGTRWVWVLGETDPGECWPVGADGNTHDRDCFPDVRNRVIREAGFYWVKGNGGWTIAKHDPAADPYEQWEVLGDEEDFSEIGPNIPAPIS